MSKVLYAIAHHSLYEKPLWKLLGSLEGIGIDQLLIVEAGTETKLPNAIPYLPVPYNAFELTPLVAVSRQEGREALDLGFTHVFLLHVTCEVGPRFKKLVEAGYSPDADVTGLSHWGQNNFGMYKIDYLVRRAEWLWGHRNMTKLQAVEVEGKLYEGAMKKALYPHINFNLQGERDVYDTGTTRQVEYWPGVDLYKFKANWNGIATKWVEKP